MSRAVRQPSIQRAKLWVAMSGLLLLQGCVCVGWCIRINGNGIVGNNCDLQHPACGYQPSSDATYVWIDPCTSPSYKDSDNDRMSDATEDNPLNGYLATTYNIVLNKNRFNANPTVAHGSVGSGTLEKGLELVSSAGTKKCGGYQEFIPLCQGEPDSYGHWGTAHLLRLIENVTDVWRLGHTRPRLAVGHMSLKDGGDFHSYCSTSLAHLEHTNGLEVDVRYIRNDVNSVYNGEGPLNVGDSTQVQYFDRAATKDLVDDFLAFGDIQVIYMYPGSYDDTSGKVVFDTGHFNHIHVTIVDPDGVN